MKKEENPNALKHFYDQALLNRMSAAIASNHPSFDEKRFKGLMKVLDELEMKPRVQFLREELYRQLPHDYDEALAILLKSARGGTLKSFDLWPLSDFIQSYGLDHPEASLEALKELTSLFSSEFAVRPFLKRHPELTLRYLLRCASDKSVDVRRWASEGSRPRLPWGERLHDFVEDPSATEAILEKLKFDSELYVRKSVSNHLNDIAKDHPDRVVKTLAAWKKEAGEKHASKIEWTIHRSLRTLIKSGHLGALKLIGASAEPQIKVKGLKIDRKKYRLGDRIEFDFKIESLSPKKQKLVIDYVVHYMKSNRLTAPKVFKLKTVELAGKSEALIAKNHSLRKITTRVHYSGEHFLEIQVNGQSFGRLGWDLVV